MTARCSHNRLRELLSYEPNKGVFTRIKSGRGYAAIGSGFGCVNGQGYLIGMIDRRIYLLHQLAWFYIHGEWADCLDHRDGDKSNNRISNLRLATRSQNSANRGMTASNSSGFKGVTWRALPRKYQAQIKIDGRSLHLGYAETAEAAGQLYHAAAIKYFGEFARQS